MEWVHEAHFDAELETLLTVYVQWIYLQAIGRVDAAMSLLQWGMAGFTFSGINVHVTVEFVPANVAHTVDF
jgi:hypothetical protein